MGKYQKWSIRAYFSRSATQPGLHWCPWYQGWHRNGAREESLLAGPCIELYIDVTAKEAQIIPSRLALLSFSSRAIDGNDDDDLPRLHRISSCRNSPSWRLGNNWVSSVAGKRQTHPSSDRSERINCANSHMELLQQVLRFPYPQAHCGRWTYALMDNYVIQLI